jgi:hypothetical protein
LVRNHAQPLPLPFESNDKKNDLNIKRVKLKLKGLPSEVAKKMTFEEQFTKKNLDKQTTKFKASLNLRFTQGGL